MYSVELKLCKDFDSSTNFTENFNVNDCISSVRDAMMKYYEIPHGANVRMWGCSHISPSKPHPLSVERTLKDEQIRSGQLVVIETQKTDGTWRRSCKSNALLAEKVTGQTGRTKPGLCGLDNLGNTCFMNSVLQCLSHCPPLAEYFLNNNYLNDLKPDGMEVDLCKAFGELLKVMWSGEYTDVSPTTFKWKVGRYAAQFVGFQQHDAQEFLTFLLDGLHEAINRAKKEKPPPTDTNHMDSDNDKQAEKSDQELAKETWESYLRKSDSIIVDTFHGLLKSSVVCPVCETVSVKFDPLCYMTLPLPQDSDCVLKVLHVPYDQSMKTTVYRITVSKFGTVRDVITKIAERVNKNPESFILAEIFKSHFHKFFSLNDSVDKIDNIGSNLMVYDVPVNVTDNQFTVAPVCHWQTNAGSDTAGSSAAQISYLPSNMFGIPFIVVLPTTPCTYETVYNLICERIGRYFRKKSEMCGGENMLTDSDNVMNVNDGLFSLYIVNGQNPTEAKKIPNDGSLLKFPDCLGKQFLALQWTVKSHKEFYKSESSSSQDLLNPQLKVKLHLQDCISIFMSTEKLGANDTWNCPKCKVSRRATKKFDLWELPNVLIILLKRFTFNRGDPMGRGMYLDSSIYCREDKLNANVEFPMTNFKLNDYLINKDHPPVSYDLCGVINHYGTLSGGHYTAYAKHKEDKQWYCFDDSHVSPESEKNVMSSSAYILFYIQNNNNKQK
ncbi:ubiquitin carboxyl-terminal hydrolase 4-like [Lycorma delicatula]|uniref:ubiquitin carboxyl-terminal hydrolase 4-like n=1 Tax=Lycorma delicatula TaxID=130591 RepID=UPI003F50E456